MDKEEELLLHPLCLLLLLLPKPSKPPRLLGQRAWGPEGRNLPWVSPRGPRRSRPRKEQGGRCRAGAPRAGGLLFVFGFCRAEVEEKQKPETFGLCFVSSLFSPFSLATHLQTTTKRSCPSPGPRRKERAIETELRRRLRGRGQGRRREGSRRLKVMVASQRRFEVEKLLLYESCGHRQSRLRSWSFSRAREMENGV